MRKMSKATKRAIEAGATFTLTRREYVAKPRLRTCQKRGPKVGESTRFGTRTPWKQLRYGDSSQQKKQLKAGWGPTSL